MPVDRDNIGVVILNAWKGARGARIEPGDMKTPNRQRSRNWIESLARRFQEHYDGDCHRVFWSANQENRKQFGRNEMLFDIAVCSVLTTRSRQGKARDLEFIAHCHWQIESEFNRTNTRELVIDMSKLVMGAAENKLFVAAHRRRGQRDILGQFAPIAACCAGRLYFCFVSHPADWADNARPPQLFEWIAGGWAEIALPAAR